MVTAAGVVVTQVGEHLGGLHDDFDDTVKVEGVVRQATGEIDKHLAMVGQLLTPADLDWRVRLPVQQAVRNEALGPCGPELLVQSSCSGLMLGADEHTHAEPEDFFAQAAQKGRPALGLAVRQNVVICAGHAYSPWS